MKKKWKSVVEEFEARGILREALDETDGVHTEEDDGFLYSREPLKLIATDKSYSSVAKPSKNFGTKVKEMLDEINKISGQNFDYRVLYKIKVVTSPIWKRLNSDTESEKKTVFTAAFGIFQLQEKYARGSFGQKSRTSDLEELLAFKERTFNPDKKALDLIINACISLKKFNIEDVNFDIIDKENEKIKKMNAVKKELNNQTKKEIEKGTKTKQDLVELYNYIPRLGTQHVKSERDGRVVGIGNKRLKDPELIAIRNSKIDKKTANDS